MVRRYTAEEILAKIRKEKIQTWFDLGLFIDHVKENNPAPIAPFSGTYKDFTQDLKRSSLAFVTFHYSVDGVTVEIAKYAKIFKKNFPGINIHYIAGKFHPGSEKIISEQNRKLELNEIRGFDEWDLYKDFYFTKLERGSEKYNALILKLWDQVVTIIDKLGNYIDKHDISLLYVVNVCSNPGNVAFSLALVLLSEYMGIPVINNNHDYYWEGGNSPVDLKEKGLRKGPRDFFFKNSDVGEFFSIIEMILPWESRSWINVNINKGQSEHIIRINGQNPANVTEIGTGLDTEEYLNIPKRQKINAYLQFEKILSRYKNTLIGYSVDDVINSRLVDKDNPKPILIGYKTKSLNKFSSENVVFLQPTRILSRKRIEVSFKLVKRIFEDEIFIDKLINHTNLKLTILITGPIATGHYEYFEKLIRSFAGLIDSINPDYRSKIFLACLFSELDQENFIKRFSQPAGIPELYNIASLILLPSKTEGRGLPIIEAAACGTPILCRRYEPMDVYKEVIGVHLSESERLKVIEFDGKNIKGRHVNDIIDRIFFPNKYVDEVLHNRNVVLKRYSLLSLNENIKDICFQLFLQLRPNEDSIQVTQQAVNKFIWTINEPSLEKAKLIDTSNRHYLPGYGRLSFMLFLKSLIDPSYFRIEQQAVRGIAMDFAREIITDYEENHNLSAISKADFYNTVDNIFRLMNGETKIRHDHSMSYRHRNKNYYPYQDFTIQELTGIINLLFREIIRPQTNKTVDESPHFFTDWNLALAQLTTSSQLAIDDRIKLMQKLHENLPIAYFPGDYIKHELEFFALQSVRSRLKLSIEEELTREVLNKVDFCIAPIYVFAQGKSIVRQMNRKEIVNYIQSGKNDELKLLYEKNILRVVSTNQLSVGIHFSQLGDRALKVLNNIRKDGGYIISNRRNAAVMTDIVDIDRFHIGKIRNEMTANILGIPIDSGYIQFAPAGVRTTLAYPTPIQTAKDFSEALKSDLYKQLCDKMGEENVLGEIRKDAISNGSPVEFVLHNLLGDETAKGPVEYSFVSGVYPDGHPWNGALAKIDSGLKKGWKFIVVSSKHAPKKVTTFIEEFKKETGITASVAWNGGYILNPELVGKLGLPESYIGSPLGLIITHTKILSPPLFNKAAMLINKSGKITIQRVNCSRGIQIRVDNQTLEFGPDAYNCMDPGKDLAYFDLMSNKETLPGNGRIFIRLAGNVVKDVIFSNKDEEIPVVPVGLTLAFNRDIFPKRLDKIEKAVEIKINGLGDIEHAIEAGPMLLQQGAMTIDMKKEGWKTNNSIRTQAARLDFTDMRGPKIAAGTDEKGNLVILTINGRIRESVGATHHDMAEILIKFGIQDAMGFDPGGSSTLVVDGKPLNISPYNRDYERNIYSLPPEPRVVSNAILGYR